MTALKNKENFKDKYLKTNVLTRKLIAGFYRRIAEMVGDLAVETVLEVGCGHGFSTRYLAEIFAGARLSASEFDAAMISDAREKNPGLEIRQESIYELSRPAGSFDLVAALEVLEHLDRPRQALAQLQKVTAKYCLLSVPQEPLWRFLNLARGKYLKSFGNTPGHLNHWSVSRFKELAGEYFQIERVETPLPWIIILGSKK